MSIVKYSGACEIFALCLLSSGRTCRLYRALPGRSWIGALRANEGWLLPRQLHKLEAFIMAQEGGAKRGWGAEYVRLGGACLRGASNKLLKKELFKNKSLLYV